MPSCSTKNLFALARSRTRTSTWSNPRRPNSLGAGRLGTAARQPCSAISARSGLAAPRQEGPARTKRQHHGLSARASSMGRRMGELSDAEDHLYRTVARLAERGPFVEVMAQAAAGLSIHFDGHETSFQA